MGHRKSCRGELNLVTFGGPEKGRFFLWTSRIGDEDLTSETVEGTSLTLQGVDDVHGGDGFPLGVLGVGDSITDDVLQEDLEDSTSLLVDETGDTLHSTTTSQTTDGGLGDTLDVVTQDFAMTLGATLSKTFTSLAATRHVSLEFRN